MLEHGAGWSLHMKDERAWPTGSIKERVAQALLRSVERNGARLRVGVVSSGNLGLALASLCGADLTVFVPAGARAHKLSAMRAYGAEVRQVGGDRWVSGADLYRAARAARRWARAGGGHLLDAWADPVAVRAHSEGTGAEIAHQLPEVRGFVCAVGSGGTLVGVARALPGVRCVAAEPISSPLEGPGGPHVLSGAGLGVVPPLWDASSCAARVGVSDEEVLAEQRARGGAGLVVGETSAAALLVARRQAETLGGAWVALVADGG